MSDPERRCPNCGALASADAEWCGQCYEPLRPARESSGNGSSVPTTVEVVGIERSESGMVWTCPECEQRNPLALGACSVCGTPFARLLQQPEPTRHVEPRTALTLSLLLPGLGHWKLGRKGDAVARIVLFVWLFGTVLVLAFARWGKGFGPIASLFLLFVGSTLILWFVSALDAYRIASDERPLVGARMLLWASAGLVVVSAVLATLVALPAARGR